MSAASTPSNGFVFVESHEAVHYERTVRSHVSRKVWKEKRLKQIRNHQASFPPQPRSLPDSRNTLTISRNKLQEAQIQIQGRAESESQQKAVNNQITLPESTVLSNDNGQPDIQQDSLLLSTERALIQLDPFHTLPCRLDPSGQDLAYRAKSLFLRSSPNWASTLFTESTGLQIAYTYRANFCSMLAAASHYLDSFSGGGPSLETLKWTSATMSCVRRTLSDPVTRDGDEALMGVFLLLATDQLVDNGKNSHLHSRALARLLRLRGGIQSLQMSHNVKLFIGFLLITPFGRAQTSHLDHTSGDAEGSAILQDWEGDVDYLVQELKRLNSYATGLENRADSVERRTLLAGIVSNLPMPTDIVEQDQRSFIICFLAVVQWDYRHRPEECIALLYQLTKLFEPPGHRYNLVDIAWVIVGRVRGGRDSKWKVIRMVKVLYRLSDGLQQRIVQLMYKLVDPRSTRDAMDALGASDFERIRREAFARLPVFQWTSSHISRQEFGCGSPASVSSAASAVDPNHHSSS